jgi:HlyD family secretion protein
MASKKRRRNLIIIGSILLIILIVAILESGKPKDLNVSTEMMKKRNITETVSANGKIQPEVEVKISPDVSGEITELYVEEGDSVKKGDLLVNIDPDIYRSNLDRIKASLDNAKANLANARARLAQSKSRFFEAEISYKRSQELHKDKVISDAEFESARTAYEVAKSEVDAANETVSGAQFTVKSTEASVSEAQKNFSRTSIYAPQDGIISRLNTEKGERVVGTSQMAGTEILRIANLENMEVSVEVSENDIVRVNEGDTALVEVEPYKKRKFKGLVTEVSNSANVTGVSADQVTNFTVKIRILRSSYNDLIGNSLSTRYPFKPGMSATVEIQTETVKGASCIPLEAVTTRKPGDKKEKGYGRGKDKKAEKNKEDEEKKDEEKKDEEEGTSSEVVFVLENGQAKMKKVKTGVQDNKYIQILEGITDKEEVIVAPFSLVSKTLKDGDKVNKVPREQLFEFKKE